MKRIRVTVTEDYLFPDDWEITQAPNDKFSCLRKDNKYFLPNLQWAEYRLEKEPDNSSPHPTWVTVSNDQEDWLGHRMQETGAEFREIE